MSGADKNLRSEDPKNYDDAMKELAKIKVQYDTCQLELAKIQNNEKKNKDNLSKLQNEVSLQKIKIGDIEQQLKLGRQALDDSVLWEKELNEELNKLKFELNS